MGNAVKSIRYSPATEGVAPVIYLDDVVRSRPTMQTLGVPFVNAKVQALCSNQYTTMFTLFFNKLQSLAMVEGKINSDKDAQLMIPNGYLELATPGRYHAEVGKSLAMPYDIVEVTKRDSRHFGRQMVVHRVELLKGRITYRGSDVKVEDEIVAIENEIALRSEKFEEPARRILGPLEQFVASRHSDLVGQDLEGVYSQQTSDLANFLVAADLSLLSRLQELHERQAFSVYADKTKLVVPISR